MCTHKSVTPQKLRGSASHVFKLTLRSSMLLHAVSMVTYFDAFSCMIQSNTETHIVNSEVRKCKQIAECACWSVIFDLTNESRKVQNYRPTLHLSAKPNKYKRGVFYLKPDAHEIKLITTVNNGGKEKEEKKRNCQTRPQKHKPVYDPV